MGPEAQEMDQWKSVLWYDKMNGWALYMCGSHCDIWKNRCDGVGGLYWFNQHGYNRILRHAVPSGLSLEKRPKTHLQAV